MGIVLCLRVLLFLRVLRVGGLLGFKVQRLVNCAYREHLTVACDGGLLLELNSPLSPGPSNSWIIFVL